MGVDRQSPADHASRTSEGELSLDAERALPSVNDGEAATHQVRGAGRRQPVTGVRRRCSARALAMAVLDAEAAGFASTTPANGTLSLINGSAAGGYPIVNYEYAIVSTRQPSAIRADDLKALLNWILTTGSSSMYLKQGGFQPLPPQVASISHALAAEISG
jgi:hypothetical protein